MMIITERSCFNPQSRCRWSSEKEYSWAFFIRCEAFSLQVRSLVMWTPRILKLVTLSTTSPFELCHTCFALFF